jgi:LAS superfamily LD-carboxypeptidase LdcB
LIGLPETTVLSSLDERQLDTIAGAIRAIEGWRAGLEYTCADAPAWALPLLTCRGGTSPQPVPPAPPPTPSTHEQWDAVRAEPSDIVSVGGIRVHRMIAGRLQQMIQAAGRDGITLAGGGFRSPSAQVELRKKHCGPTSYDIYQKPSSQCHPPTARPGHSRHEQGLAIDFNTKPGVVPWLRANAARFGFVNLPSEPWHWSVDGR